MKEGVSAEEPTTLAADETEQSVPDVAGLPLPAGEAALMWSALGSEEHRQPGDGAGLLHS
jgi:hypothetical protein